MYNMTQDRLPAPYELNQPQSQPEVPIYSSPQSFARGGRASRHHKGMSKVHMNPHELRILDHLQGGAKYGHEGIKEYSHLEELLKNPHIVENVHHHARQHHAHGGLTPEMEHLREGGRYGDSELAMIGPHTHRLFNELAGHATRNPYTGHPEYFSLRGALSGLWNTIKGGARTAANYALPAMKGIAQAVAPTILPMAQSALGKRFGGAGAMAGQLLSNGVQSLLGQPSGENNPYYTAIGQGIGRGAQAYSEGAGPSQAFGRGLNTFGSELGGGIGNALSQSGQALQQGQGWGEAARRGAERGYSELGGAQGLRNAAGEIGHGLMHGGIGGARQAIGNQMNQYMQRALPMAANQEHLPHHEELAEMYG